MSVALTGDGPNISLTGSGSSFTITVTTGGGGGGVTDHGALTGLGDDDHTQYAKKASNLADLTDAATARTNLGLGTAATSASSAFAAASHVHATSDITSGTMATARLGSGTANSGTFLRGDQTWSAPPTTVVGTLGTQTAITEATSGWNPGASVGSLTLPALVAGDLVMFNAVISWVNNAGASRTLRAGVTLGTTTNITAAAAGTASGTTRELSVSGFVHVLSTTSQIVSATFVADNTTSFSVAAATTEDVSTAKALGLVAGSNSTTGTQSATLRNLHVRRVSA